MITILRSASLGGAALNPPDPSIRVAPIRTKGRVKQTPAPLHYPTDPWPEQRIGYPTAQPELLFPPANIMCDFLRYLESTY